MGARLEAVELFPDLNVGLDGLYSFLSSELTADRLDEGSGNSYNLDLYCQYDFGNIILMGGYIYGERDCDLLETTLSGFHAGLQFDF